MRFLAGSRVALLLHAVAFGCLGAQPPPGSLPERWMQANATKPSGRSQSPSFRRTAVAQESGTQLPVGRSASRNVSAPDPHNKLKPDLRAEFGDKFRKAKAAETAQLLLLSRSIHELRPGTAKPARVVEAVGSASAPHGATRSLQQQQQQQWTEHSSDDTFRRLCLLLLVSFFGCAACAPRSVLVRVDSSGEGLCTAAAVS